MYEQSCSRSIVHCAIQVLICMMCLMPSAAAACPSGRGKAEVKTDADWKARASRAWERIRSSDQIKYREFEDNPIDYWFALSHRKHFGEMVKGSNLREKIQFFVERFGEEGAEADIRWILADPGATTNLGGGAGGLYSIENGNESSKRRREIQLLIAEFQVRQFLHSRKKLHRYFHFTIWQRVILSTKKFPVQVSLTRQGFTKKPKEDFWWYARDLLLFAYATGRDDLLKSLEEQKELTPELFKRKFLEWFEWMKHEGGYLRPSKDGSRWILDLGEKRRKEVYLPFAQYMELPPLENLPKTPFADWKGPPPPLEPATFFDGF